MSAIQNISGSQGSVFVHSRGFGGLKFILQLNFDWYPACVIRSKRDIVFSYLSAKMPPPHAIGKSRNVMHVCPCQYNTLNSYKMLVSSQRTSTSISGSSGSRRSLPLLPYRILLPSFLSSCNKQPIICVLYFLLSMCPRQELYLSCLARGTFFGTPYYRPMLLSYPPEIPLHSLFVESVRGR